MHTARRVLLPRAGRLLVWLLLCLLPLQGLAAVLVQALGPLHFHAQPVVSLDPMHGWQDFRRQIDGGGHAASASHHAHDDLTRHHHAQGATLDASAVTLDPGAGAGVQPDEVFTGASGALGQVIGPLGAQAVPPAAGAQEAWPEACATTMQSWLPASIERPPRAR